MLPDIVLEELRGHDAILLGAVGDPACRRACSSAGLLLRLRFELDHYVNLRPGAAVRPASPAPLAGKPGESTSWSSGRAPRVRTSAPAARCAQGTPHEIATEVSVNTAFGVERVVRDAFARAAARPRGAS